MKTIKINYIHIFNCLSSNIKYYYNVFYVLNTFLFFLFYFYYYYYLFIYLFIYLFFILIYFIYIYFLFLFKSSHHKV